MLVASKGPAVALGDFCEVITSSGRRIRTQVTGFRNGHVLSMPLEDIDGMVVDGDSLYVLDDTYQYSVYDAVITREAIDGLMKFAKSFGLIDDVVPYEAVVATELTPLWKE